MTTTAASRIEVGQLNGAPTDASCVDGRPSKNLSQLQWSDTAPATRRAEQQSPPIVLVPKPDFLTFTPVAFAPADGRAVYNLVARTWSLEPAP